MESAETQINEVELGKGEESSVRKEHNVQKLSYDLTLRSLEQED